MFGIYLAQATSDYSTKLELLLLIDKQQCKKDRLALTVVLKNKGSETLTLIVPTNPNPLSVLLLTNKGYDERLAQLSSLVKNNTNKGKTIVLVPKQELVFKTLFDLSPFLDELTSKPFVEFKARFGISYANPVYSNKVQYVPI